MTGAALSEDDLVARVRTLYPDAIVDVAGENCNFEMFVISEAFAGQTILQRQRPILALFKDDIQSGALHALSVTAKTPGERAAPSGLVQITR